MALATVASHGRLLRILGLAFGVAAVVGGMVGQGILRTPGIVAGAVHSPELILSLWAFGAVLAAIGAFAYVELGTAIPCAGGPYDFARRAYGSLAAVLTGWAAWLIQITVNAFLAIVVAEFLHRLGVWPGLSTSVLAVAVLGLFWALNWTGTRIAGGSQIAFSAIKGAALIGLVVILFAQPQATAQQPTTELGGAVGLAAIATAMRAIINTYGGWEDLVYFSEEMEKPERTLPRAMATGIASVAILYLLVNVALLWVLTPANLAGSEFPAADAAEIALGTSGGVALTLFGVISVAGITNLTLMKSARVAFALSRQGHLPSKLSQVASSGTPRTALTVSTILAAAIAATGTYETVVAMNVAVAVTLVIVVNLAAISLRKKEPSLARPYRIPLYPLPVFIAIVVNLALLAALIFEDPLNSMAGFVALGAVAVVYFVLQRSRERARAPAA